MIVKGIISEDLKKEMEESFKLSSIDSSLVEKKEEEKSGDFEDLDIDFSER